MRAPRRLSGSMGVGREEGDEQLRITCGIDWSEKHHDVALVASDAAVVARARISDDAAGFAALVAMHAEHGGQTGPQEIEIAIETDKGLLVAALVGAGFAVFPINPRAVARYRERYGQAGGKSDPGDAVVLANILRTDQHVHRRLPADSERAREVKTLARQHKEAIWARQQTVNRLRSLLREYYPAALVAFPTLTHRAALTVLRAAPSPAEAARLTERKVIALLRRSGRGNQPGLATRIREQLRAETLRQPPAVETAMGLAVAGLIDVVTAMSAGIAALEDALTTAFAEHHAAEVISSLPGLGPVLSARVLGELGDDPQRFADIAGLRGFAGTAPITRASGKARVVSARHIRNDRLADACHWWAFAAITKSPGARIHYDRRRAAGDSHNAALRNLANKLLAKLWYCLHTDVRYDEAGAWPAGHQPESPQSEPAAA